MSTAVTQPTIRTDVTEPDYPTSDGRPMGETDLHRSVMFDTINTLIDHFAGQSVYVTGNLLLFYEEGNRRKHVSPDCMVVRGAEMQPRDYYLLWAEGRTPNAVLEITSKTTRREDMKTKMQLYRDVIRVAEYFLFDPTQDYLKPRLQGFRRVEDRFEPIEMIGSRLPSRELLLDLEADGTRLRLYDPAIGRWLPTPAEAREQADAAREQADAAREQADAAREQADAARRAADAENQRLQAEIAELRRKLADKGV
jgi:Uma2 family endonuclease